MIDVGMSTCSCYPCSIILFVYFLSHPSILHSTIYLIDFYTCSCHFFYDYKSVVVAIVILQARGCTCMLNCSPKTVPVGNQYQLSVADDDVDMDFLGAKSLVHHDFN